MRTPAFTLALLLTASTSLAAYAQTTTRAGYVRGGAKSAPRAPVAAPRPRAAATPSARRGQPGFNFNRDIAAPAQHRTQPIAVHRPPAARPHAPYTPGNDASHRNRPVIANPLHRGQRPWTWNHGVTWNAAPAYWGGGFWGPFEPGEPSYNVAPDSPGATLLVNYQLTQTPCGQPDLVVIFGPDDGTICTYPNDTVAPGEYDIDWSTLTLVSHES